MKNIIVFLAALFLMQSCVFAQKFSIINTSYNNSDSICFGSAQWIDVVCTGNPLNQDKVIIYISENQTHFLHLLDTNYAYYYVVSLPYNADSISKRLYFNMPL